MTKKNQKLIRQLADKNQKLTKLLRLPGKSRSSRSSRSSRTSKLPKPSKARPDPPAGGEGSPQTMEELVALYGEKVKGFKRGEEIEGKVTAISGKSIYFDIGGKTEGVALGKEFEACKDFIKTLKVGDKVKLRVGNPENERGQILLSLRKAAHDHAWKFFEEKLKSLAEIQVRGKELNKGGLIVFAPSNLQGFVPGSQLGSVWQGKHQTLINRLIKVKVIEVDRKENRLVFSERLVSEADKIAAEEAALKKIKTGEVYEGDVLQVLPYGLMVEVKVNKAKVAKVQGLVHISEISWGKVDDLGKFYQVGEKVKVKVLKTEESKLQLSIKQLTSDPWQELEKKYPKDTLIKGEVKRLAAYGALVEVEPGIEGLLHISKIPPDFQIDTGDKISCFIESTDIENRKLSLGLVLKKKPVGYK